MDDIVIQILCIIEELIWLAGILQIPITKSKIRRTISIIIFILVLCSTRTNIIGSNMVPVIFALKMMTVICLFEDILSIKILKYIFTVFYMNIITIPASLVCLVIRYYDKIESNGFAYKLLYENFVVAGSIIILFIIHRRKLEGQIRGLSGKYYLLGILLGFCGSVISYAIKISALNMPTIAGIFVMINGELFVESMYFLGIILVVLNNLRIRFYKESILKEKYLGVLKEHYKSLQNNIQEVRTLKHDMKYQNTVVFDLLCDDEVEDAKAYLKKMNEGLNIEILKKVNTGNNTADAIITSEKSKMKDIKFTCEGVFAESIPIDDYDLCIIIANVLSNAREACDKINGSEKWISLDIKSYKGHLVMIAENPIDWMLMQEHTELMTTKDNHKAHGFGLKSVEKTVKKYNGDVIIDNSSQVFQIKIVI